MIDEFMKSKGYSDRTPDPIYSLQGVVYWYKKIPRTDHQVIVKMWPSFPPSDSSFEVEMIYETRNGIWANTKYYGLSEGDLRADLDRLEECLKQATAFMDANPWHYRFDGRD